MKKLLVSLLCVVMMVTFMPSMAFAVELGDLNDGTRQSSAAGETKDKNEKNVINENDVAKIGEVRYATLKEAIDEAQGSDKIELLSDVTESITLNKGIVIDGNNQYKIYGLTTVKQGKLQNLTLAPNETNINGSLLVLGNTVETKINLENVTLNYSVTKRSSGSAVTVSGNKATIIINDCLFTNAPNNNGVVENAPEWSYGLYINEQADEGKINFTNNEFNGAFRTMLPNSSGNMLIENNKFINSVHSVANGPTGGSAGEATSITTSAAANNNLVVRNNVFDNAGCMYFQTQITLENNEIAFDRFEHYIQVAGKVGEKVDISCNSFKVSDNGLFVYDTVAAPLVLPANLEAISGWVFLDTPEAVRPVDYSDYKYMYNEDGTITFKPQSDVALDQFLNQNAGNLQVSDNDTVLIEKDLKVDTITIEKDTNINFAIQNNASLTISEKMDVAGKAKISGDGKFILSDETKANINDEGTLDISKNTKVENNGTITNEGTLTIPDVVEGSGTVTGSGTKEELHNAVKVEAKGPTCTTDGNKEYWYCACGKYFSDAGCNTEITKDETVLKAAGHKYENGFCTECGEKQPGYVPPTVITYYDITVTQPEHGKIVLSTDRIYRYGDVDVTLTAEEGYEVKDLLINGKSVGAVSSYTIEDITEDIHVTAVFGETDTAKKARIIKGVQDTDIKLTYKMDEIGKGWIKIRWTKEKGYAVDYYEVFRSAKSKSNFGKEAYFTKDGGKINNWYKNTKQIKKGTRYYYKVRGVREIDGQKYYTKWSNITWRTGR